MDTLLIEKQCNKENTDSYGVMRADFQIEDAAGNMHRIRFTDTNPSARVLAARVPLRHVLEESHFFAKVRHYFSKVLYCLAKNTRTIHTISIIVVKIQTTTLFC